MNKEINNAKNHKNKRNLQKVPKNYYFKREIGSNTINFITFQINYYMLDVKNSPKIITNFYLFLFILNIKKISYYFN